MDEEAGEEGVPFVVPEFLKVRPSDYVDVITGIEMKYDFARASCVFTGLCRALFYVVLPHTCINLGHRVGKDILKKKENKSE